MIVLSHSALVMLNVHINFSYVCVFGKNALSAALSDASASLGRSWPPSPSQCIIQLKTTCKFCGYNAC